MILLAGCSTQASVTNMPTTEILQGTHVSNNQPTETTGEVQQGLTPLSTETGNVTGSPATRTTEVTDPATTETAVLQTATPDTRLPPERWKEWPIIPVISDKARQIYQQGIAGGNDPKSFSKIGDCQSIKEALMGMYDMSDRYQLPANAQYLQETIDNFSGSFNRDGYAVKGGFNAASVLSPMWADPDVCLAGETPVECEFRVHEPSFVIISLEVWWKGRTIERYDAYMRQIIEYAISQGVVPILSTKADNVEGDNSINLASARLAYEYDIPLWNFWLAVQPLDNHGLEHQDPKRSDGFHISYEAWNVRSFTALKALDAAWRFVRKEELASTPTPMIEITASSTPAIQPTSTPVDLASQSELLDTINVSGDIYLGLAQKKSQSFENTGVFKLSFVDRKFYQIAGSGYNLQAASPEGDEILINQQGQLYRADREGKIIQRVSQSFYWFGQVGAFYSKDPEGIYYIEQKDGKQQIVFMDIGSSQTTIISQISDSPVSLYPLSDPKKIYWESGTCTAFEVCDLNGVWLTNLADKQSSAIDKILNPVFSENGKYYAYNIVVNTDKNNLFIASLDDETNRNIELEGNNLVDYAWSPANDRLSALTLIRSDYSGKSSQVRVFTVTIDKWAIQEFDPYIGLDAKVIWSPDSQNLLLSSTQPQDSGFNRLDLRIYNLTLKRLVDLGEVINVQSSDFIYRTNVFWMP